VAAEWRKVEARRLKNSGIRAADISDRGEGNGVEIRYFEPYARIWALPDKPGCRGACDWRRDGREKRIDEEWRVTA